MDSAISDLSVQELVERFLSAAPFATISLLLVTAGAFGAYWLYRKGRRDERDAVVDYLERFRR